MKPARRSSSPRVQRRRDAARVAILRAAGRIFRERGFAETAMRDIAAGADLSVANLYLHFSGKDEILYFCQDRSLDLMLGALEGGDGLPSASTACTPCSARTRRHCSTRWRERWLTWRPTRCPTPCAGGSS